MLKVDVAMSDDDQFHVSGWWAKSPDYVIEALRRQLEAAQAIWPELHGYDLVRRGKRLAGEAGGHARAESLSPERRSEIASEAAKARWGTND